MGTARLRTHLVGRQLRGSRQVRRLRAAPPLTPAQAAATVVLHRARFRHGVREKEEDVRDQQQLHSGDVRAPIGAWLVPPTIHHGQRSLPRIVIASFAVAIAAAIAAAPAAAAAAANTATGVLATLEGKLRPLCRNGQGAHARPRLSQAAHAL